MFTDENALELARHERAPAHLRTAILSKVRRRRTMAGFGGVAAFAGLVAVSFLALPRPAYANPEVSLALSQKQPVIYMKAWRNIRGVTTPPTETWSSKSITRIRNAWIDMVDDGTRHLEYWIKEGHLYEDVSDKASFRGMTGEADPGEGLRKLIAARGWKQARHSVVQYRGRPATELTAHGTYRDSGKDNTIEIKMITEPNNGRVLYTETWRDGHTWADFAEYAYPERAEFKVDAPAGTPSRDLRALRAEFVKSARAASKSDSPQLVAIYRGYLPSLIAITHGGAPPDPHKPQDIRINGKRVGIGDSYAFVVPGQHPFPALGSGFHFQSGGPISRTEPIPPRGDVEVWFWKKVRGVSMPEKRVLFKNVEIQLVPSPHRFLAPLMRLRRPGGSASP